MTYVSETFNVSLQILNLVTAPKCLVDFAHTQRACSWLQELDLVSLILSATFPAISQSCC